jgi:hypothetical protein
LAAVWEELSPSFSQAPGDGGEREFVGCTACPQNYEEYAGTREDLLRRIGDRNAENPRIRQSTGRGGCCGTVHFRRR